MYRIEVPQQFLFQQEKKKKPDLQTCRFNQDPTLSEVLVGMYPFYEHHS